MKNQTISFLQINKKTGEIVGDHRQTSETNEPTLSKEDSRKLILVKVPEKQLPSEQIVGFYKVDTNLLKKGKLKLIELSRKYRAVGMQVIK